MKPLTKVALSSFTGSFLATLAAVAIAFGGASYLFDFNPLSGAGTSAKGAAAPAEAKRAAEPPAARTATAPKPVASPTGQLSIATGGTGGVYNPLGRGVAEVLSKYMAGTTASAEATSASADNCRLVAEGKVQIAFTQADTAWDAYKGYNKFEKPLPIRALLAFYPNRLHLVTLAGSGITRVKDLRGKRVSTGAAGSGTEIWGGRLFDAHDINPDKDFTRQRLGLKGSIEALKEKKIDAFVWASGVPAKALADFAKEPGVSIRLLDTASAVNTMLLKHGPVYVDGKIPAASYDKQPREVRVAEVWNLLVVREDADDQTVRNVLKTLLAHKPDLLAVHEQANYLDLSHQSLGESPIPYHPAAKKFFEEQAHLALAGPRS